MQDLDDRLEISSEVWLAHLTRNNEQGLRQNHAKILSKRAIADSQTEVGPKQEFIRLAVFPRKESHSTATQACIPFIILASTVRIRKYIVVLFNMRAEEVLNSRYVFIRQLNGV